MPVSEPRPLSVPALERYAYALDEVAKRQKRPRFRIGGRGLALILALIAIPSGAALATEFSDDNQTQEDLSAADDAYQSIVEQERLTSKCAEILASGVSHAACERIAADAGTIDPGGGD